ncbi:ATP-binding protein [Kitasatospora sp. NPDC086791]|uniref:AlbA family DNA-binding domain-containing protein n=1 Tax=Kitasatospora sp. NPDC086791 TaxID=3155178 RepID=UPI003420717F
MDFRSRRLEALFGGRLDYITYQDIADVVDNPDAAEYEDLDYKRELTAKDEEGKEEFAKDVVSFANHLGGLIVVGLADAKGIPSQVFDSDVSDAHQRHLRQVAARRIAPAVRLEMRAVHNPEKQGRGFLLIAVPRSPHTPHAILGAPIKAAEEALRFPRRSGSRTEWLTETAIATAYYRRIATAAEQEHRLDGIEREALAALPPSNRPHLLVVLAPEGAGDMPIDQASFERYRTELKTWPTLITMPGSTFADVRIGARRITAEGGYPTGSVRCELHKDGSGAFLVRLREDPDIENGEQYHGVDPSDLVLSLLSALHLIGAHARDRTAALDTAIIRAALIEAPHTHPRGPKQPPMTPFPSIQIERTDMTGFRRRLSSQACAYAHAEAAGFLNDLADGGQGLVQTASLLADELVQAFGLAEAPPLTRQGEIREAGWSRQHRADIVAWAQQHDVPVLQ